MRVNVFVWKASQEQLSLVDRIVQVIRDYAKIDLDFLVKDLSSFTQDKSDTSPIIAFGSMASKQMGEYNGPVYILPNLTQLEPTEANKEVRVRVAKHLKEIASELSQPHKDESLDTAVEVQNTLIGTGSISDIQLTQAEIDTLLKIKQLFGGGTVIIKKGDIRIEVPNGEAV